MIRPLATAIALALLVGTTGCATLAPAVPEADAGVAVEWPIPPVAAPSDDAATATTADIGWREVYRDPRLAGVIDLALRNNRDLRIAALNVERARSYHRIQRADRLPSVGGSVALERVGGDVPRSDTYTAGVGVADFELDLFGRVRNLSQAALERYLASEEARGTVQIGLVAEVAGAWIALAADRELQRLADATLQAYETSLALTEKRHALGAVSSLDLQQSRVQVEAARADAARYAGQVAQDLNALNLLAGAMVPESLLPERIESALATLVTPPDGLPSDVLLRRPDVRAAEHQLRAANADIGAARAAFFPSIRLTGSVGSASSELSDLFSGGTGLWSFMPSIQVPIFQGGRLRAALGVAQADRDIALAQYEKAIQAAFRDTADALALAGTLDAQRRAQEALVAAATQAHALSKARYEAGQDSFLQWLDAQRTLYGAQQGLVATRLAEQANRIALYRALGGGWRAEAGEGEAR